MSTKEDSEHDSSEGADPGSPGSEEVNSKQRAHRWAEDIRSRPMTDEQTTELAKVYGILAVVEALEATTAAVEAIRTPLGKLLAYIGLAGGLIAPEAVSQHDSDEQDTGQ